MPALLQSIPIYLGSFILVLSVVVFVHEFGHFQVARWRKVAIDTFSIGFGKTLFGWRDKQGVQWKVGALPLGGYVKFADDADALSTAPVEAIDDPVAKAEARRRGLFHAQPLSTRAMVVAAGPMTNFVFSIFAFGVFAMISGRDTTDYTSVRPLITSVAEGTAAEAAGIRDGEIVEAVNGAQVRGLQMFQSIIAAHPEQPLQLTLRQSNGDVRTLTATPRAAERTGANGTLERFGSLGLNLGVLPEERIIEPVGPLAALQFGAGQTWGIITTTVDYIVGIFTGRHSGRDIAGPLGILNVSGQVATASLNAPPSAPGGPIGTLALSLLGLAAMLSVAVGFVNLLPIPLLDGGHLFFYSIEALRGGKPLPPVAQEWAYKAGFLVMGSLFLFATWNDITRLFPGGPG
jgi:regulator of sigma E protease